MNFWFLFDVVARLFFTVGLPLLLALVALLLWRNLRRGVDRRSLLRISLGALAFLLADLLMVTALPALRISFGKIHFSAAVFFGLRFMLYLLWLFLRLRGPVHPAPYWSANVLASLLLIYAFAVEPSMITLTHVEMTAPYVDRKVRIVQLSDIHMERASLRDDRLPGVVISLQPDMIVLTGDYLSTSNLNDPRAEADLHALAARLRAPMGIYAVQGTVDSQAGMRRMFEGTGVTILDNAVAEIDHPGVTIDVLGISDWQSPSVNFEQSPPLRAESFQLLLFHTPDLADRAAAHGIDLYLAGHTHGGQVRLPFYGALVTFSHFGKQFEMGRYQIGPTTLYVSRGLGMEGYSVPRVRFLAPPEVVVIDLVPVQTED